MTVPLPPITGDAKLDSWALEVTNSIGGQGIAGGGAGGAGGGGGGGGNAVVGRDGFNFAAVKIYQRTARADDGSITAPVRLSLDTLWNFVTDVLTARADADSLFDLPFPQENWYVELPPRDNMLADDFIWIQTVNISSRTSTDFIASGDWSMVGLESRPGLGALRADVEYSALSDVDEPDFTVVARAVYLGEEDVTPQVGMSQICWLVAEDTGVFNVDRFGFSSLPAGYPEAFDISPSNGRVGLEVTIVSGEPAVWIALGAPTGVVGEVFTVTINGTVLSGEGVGTTSTTDRNFTNGSPNHPGLTTVFMADEIFTSNTDASGGERTAVVSRDIEPRIDISAFINI